MRSRDVTRAVPVMAALLTGTLLTTTPGVAWTQELPIDEPSAAPSERDVAEASRLYEAGTEAHRAGRYQEAARAFARADELVPDAAALQAALLAALETDDAVLVMELASRTAREPFNAPLMELADQARRRFGSQVGRVVVHCDDCEAEVDGAAIPRGIATFVEVGPHEVVIRVGQGAAQRRERREVAVESGSVVTLVPVSTAGDDATPGPAPVPTPGVAHPDRASAGTGGISPVWFWVGLGLTGAAAAGTIVSGVDTLVKRADFEDSPSEETAQAGESSQLRTNILVGVTAGMAVLTGVVGLVAVDWEGAPSSDADADATSVSVTLAPLGAGGWVDVRVAF